MGYTQYLDLAREHRSLVLIGLSSGVTYRPFIFSLSLDSSSLLSFILLVYIRNRCLQYCTATP
jgi:hypothetical protein